MLDSTPREDGSLGEYQKFLEVVRTWQGLHERGDLRFVRAGGEPVIAAQGIPPEQVDLERRIAADQAGYTLTKGSDVTF